MEEALLSYSQNPLRVVHAQDAVEKSNGVEVNLQHSLPAQEERRSFIFPQISMPVEPAGYIKANKYDHY